MWLKTTGVIYGKDVILIPVVFIVSVCLRAEK